MTRTDGFARIRVGGRLLDADDVATLDAAITFVPEDEHLIVDLDGVAAIGEDGVATIAAALRRRAEWSEAVVVSPRMDLTMHLVLHDLDRAVPIVRTVEHAAEVIRARAGLFPALD